MIQPPALNGAHDQDRTGDLILTKDVLYRLSYVGWLPLFYRSAASPPSIKIHPDHDRLNIPKGSKQPHAEQKWSGKRDSNPRPSAWKADALATELLPLIADLKPSAAFLTQMTAAANWWRGEGSNLRRLRRQIYSLLPLTAREPLQGDPSGNDLPGAGDGT